MSEGARIGAGWLPTHAPAGHPNTAPNTAPNTTPNTAPNTPVTLLAGDAELSAAAAARWLAQRPAGERWAVIGDVGSGAVPFLALALPPTVALPVEFVDFSGGCVCCLAASAFSLVIARLLRKGPFQRLLIVLPTSADPGAVADGLLGGPLAGVLGTIEILASYGSALDAAPAGSLATRVIGASDLVASNAPLPGIDDAGADPEYLRVNLAALNWPLVRGHLDRRRSPARWRWLVPLDAPADASAQVAAPALSILPGGGWQSLGRAARPGDSDCVAWVWPASSVFGRKVIEGALRALVCDPAMAHVQALIRTRREWYSLSGRADKSQWAPTLSRRESRIECQIRPGARWDPDALLARWVACLDSPAPPIR